MDQAKDLVRSVARAFYDPRQIDTRHIVIIDALILHSALRDDDLGFLMSMNTKDLHKLCGRLKEDRFIQVHIRPELREGQQRPVNRTWYYIDYRQTIDAIKWRMYHLDKSVQGNAVPASEKKEYFCNFCKAEWTQMEVLDKVGPRGFECHRCGRLLVFDPERQSGGHEQSTRLNNQLQFITKLLPQLDSVFIPDNTFEVAYSAHLPVKRDATNQVAASIAVETSARPTAVKGLADTGPQSININIKASEQKSEEEKQAEAVEKAEKAAQNALPDWMLKSSVEQSSNTLENVNNVEAKDEEEEDKKHDADALNAEEQGELDDMLAMLKKQQEEEQARKAAEEEEDEEDEDEEDEDAFEDVTAADTTVEITSSVGGKRAASSGVTSTADTPASDEKPSKKVKVEEPTNDDDSEDEDLAFEDV